MKKIFYVLFTLLVTGSFLVGCKNSNSKNKDSEDQSNEQILNSNSILSIVKTSSIDNIDTYTISYSNGTYSTFTVTNGIDGATGNQGIQGNPGKDGHTPVITVGSNGNWYIDGVDSNHPSALQGNTGNGISEIKLTSQNDNIDTYTIFYTDGNKTTFTVTNGVDGKGSISIGDNGTLIINEIDTGIIVDYSKVDNRVMTTEQKFSSSGLNYALKTINGITGYVVTEYYSLLDVIDYYRYANLISYDEYIEFGDSIEGQTNGLDIVIPNYIGSLPVIGIEASAFRNQSFIWNVSISKNTIYIGDYAFENCTNLKYFDFNESSVKNIGINCFKNDSNLSEVEFPDTITYVGNYAFYNCNLTNFNFTSVKHIGSYAFNGFMSNVYLPKTVEYIGDYAFNSGYLFLEHDEIPSVWGTNINGTETLYSSPVLGCINNGEYIYTLENDEITLHQYLGNETKLIIPEYIDGITVKNIGYGFNSYIYYLSNKLVENKIEYNTKGKVKELIIPSYINKIDYGSLVSNDVFVYVSKGVKEVWSGVVLFDDYRIGCVVFEDPTSSTFNIDNSLYGYEAFTRLNNIEEAYRYFTNYDYSKIYYDDNTKTFYYNESTYYSVFACFDFAANEIVIPDVVNGLPVKQIGKYAFGYIKASKITIGKNISKIKSNAFDCSSNDQNVYIYIPKNVEIINSSGFVFKDPNYYVEESQKPDDWDSNWNNGNYNIVYSYTLDEFNSYKVYDDFIYTIVENEVYLLKYNGEDSTIRIPRTIDNKTVTTIKSEFFTSSNYINIYIPSTVTTIESNAFINTSYNYYSFYFEAAFKDTNISSQYYYSSCYQNYSSYKFENLNVTFDY